MPKQWKAEPRRAFYFGASFDSHLWNVNVRKYVDMTKEVTFVDSKIQIRSIAPDIRLFHNSLRLRLKARRIEAAVPENLVSSEWMRGI